MVILLPLGAPPNGDSRFRSVRPTVKSPITRNNFKINVQCLRITFRKPESDIPNSDFHFRSMFIASKIRTRKRSEINNECLYNAYRKPGSTYRMVLLLPFDGATYCEFYFRPILIIMKICINSQAVRTEVGLRIRETFFYRGASWRSISG